MAEPAHKEETGPEAEPLPKVKKPFELVSDYSPRGDQPAAIEQLVDGVDRGLKAQVLLGVTGSGKTFTIANTIARTNRPTLVLAHNKTLAAQLYQELKSFFPNNAVEYFVSYYDYYQPEAYVPSTDTFIEKDALINDAIDRLRHSATQSLLTREDVIIVASVSCIYGIGGSESYRQMTSYVEVGKPVGRDNFLRQLVEGQFERNDVSFHRGTFRVRGDVVEVFPAHQDETALRVEFFGDDVDRITVIDPLRGKTVMELEFATIWPASHYATTQERRKRTIDAVRIELQERLTELRDRNKLVEAQRLEQRCLFDLEMLEATGSCRGVENYSRHLSGREEGQPPPTLLDYFPRDFLMILDESHQTVPQVGAMYRGDRARKETLVEHGFRLKSALDNRPLKFEEWEEHVHQAIFVSATPNDYEIDRSDGIVVEQLIRPTGLLDPVVEVRPATTQVDDLIGEARAVTERGGRVLVTTLTKRMAEDLTEYLQEVGIKTCYLHSDIDTLERVEILSALRRGEHDVLVGINLLREGLDLPEVELVAILDADKEGFLRATTGLIQTIGRAARNAEGRAILYADHETDSMRAALEETRRRRAIQEQYNEDNGIEPKTIMKAIREMDPDLGYVDGDYVDLGDLGRGRARSGKGRRGKKASEYVDDHELPALVEKLRGEMNDAAKDLEFEKAAEIRDRIHAYERRMLKVGL
jgi:excinuclease ABC subunit B